ncbi:hypothetical protein GCM10010124_11360 [Pilimelia terevasa]|uniref:DUF4360 domain-containing protein n=1 Tax=Pilimelia terevasa TaxID=53372 RepID=A0A8J3FHA8_9ACTN|nr:DUF4360 domain-containing protein [Pilimelia terevasa]GGK20476.1 hypothetical protein GCM10010124_11360 [Pilimelia terevasa]
MARVPEPLSAGRGVVRRAWSLVLCAGLVLLPSGATAAPGADRLRIVSATGAGPGCRQGAYLASVSEDAQAFLILYDDFRAEVPSGGRYGDFTNCSLLLNVDVPERMSYSLTKVVHEGSGRMTRHARIALMSNVFFVGQAQPVPTVNDRLVADDDKHHGFLSVEEIGAPQWSECGRDSLLRVFSGLRAEAPAGGRAEAYFGGTTSETLHFRTRSC